MLHEECALVALYTRAVGEQRQKFTLDAQPYVATTFPWSSFTLQRAAAQGDLVTCPHCDTAGFVAVSCPYLVHAAISHTFNPFGNDAKPQEEQPLHQAPPSSSPRPRQ